VPASPSSMPQSTGPASGSKPSATSSTTPSESAPATP
jgi:hypothetical protein